MKKKILFTVMAGMLFAGSLSLSDIGIWGEQEFLQYFARDIRPSDHDKYSEKVIELIEKYNLDPNYTFQHSNFIKGSSLLDLAIQSKLEKLQKYLVEKGKEKELDEIVVKETMEFLEETKQKSSKKLREVVDEMLKFFKEEVSKLYPEFFK